MMREHIVSFFGVVPDSPSLIPLPCIFWLKWLLHTTLIPAETTNTFLCFKITLYISFWRFFFFYCFFFVCFLLGLTNERHIKTQAVLIFHFFWNWRQMHFFNSGKIRTRRFPNFDHWSLCPIYGRLEKML